MNEWISLNSRMPPVREHILVFDDGFVGTAFFEAGDIRSIEALSPIWAGLTHWMPLPLPPESQENALKGHKYE